jgi:hypothetical protein
MNYQKIYNDLIEKRKKQPYTKGYSEKHHIIPKSLGGSDDKDNLVLLTAKEHYIAHALLYFIDNDKGERDFFFIYSIGGILEFPDVTNEYRNEIIDGILT